MTKEEILSANLDTLRLLVAEHVLKQPTPLVSLPAGWEDWWYDAEGRRIPQYATLLDDAWLVFDWLRGRYSNVALHADNGYGCTAWRLGSDASTLIVGPVNAPTAAEAICRTALLACLEQE